MGTSADFGGGRGEGWTGLRRATTSFAKRGGRDRAARVLARYVGALGGAASASRAAAGSTQRMAGFASALATGGLGPALDALGLGHLVGSSRWEVLQGLLEVIVGAGADLDEQAARAAACDVFDELFPDAESWEELAEVSLDADGVVDLIERFVAACVFNRMLPAIDERLNRLGDPTLARRRETELRDYLRLLVQLRLEDRDPLTVDWQGDEGRVLITGLLEVVYEELEALEDG
jgi:hypothetical protein